MGRYSGIKEQRAKYELLHYLELDCLISKKRFSRRQLESLSVPYSVARAFTQGKPLSNTYKSINEADPKLVWLIKELANWCRYAAQLDKIKGNPNIETNIYR
jgi:hypothetical protein